MSDHGLGRTWGDWMTEKSIWQIVKDCAKRIGMPKLAPRGFCHGEDVFRGTDTVCAEADGGSMYYWALLVVTPSRACQALVNGDRDARCDGIAIDYGG
jgi:hypothetical protein